jgi:hypothetical protein
MSPSPCSNRRCLSSATSCRHTKKMLSTKDEINYTCSINHDTVLTSGIPAISRISMVRERGAASSADESANAIRPYAAIAAAARRSCGSATTRKYPANSPKERDRVAGRPTRPRGATIRLRLAAVKLPAGSAPRRVSTPREPKSVPSLAKSMATDPAAGASEIAARPGLPDLRELLMPRQGSGA